MREHKKETPRKAGSQNGTARGFSQPTADTVFQAVRKTSPPTAVAAFGATSGTSRQVTGTVSGATRKTPRPAPFPSDPPLHFGAPAAFGTGKVPIPTVGARLGQRSGKMELSGASAAPCCRAASVRRATAAYAPFAPSAPAKKKRCDDDRPIMPRERMRRLPRALRASASVRTTQPRNPHRRGAVARMRVCAYTYNSPSRIDAGGPFPRTAVHPQIQRKQQNNDL